MRINARLDDNAADKLDYLQQKTGLSLSDVVRESIEHYYTKVRDRAECDAAALDALVGAFAGSDDSPTDLSADYKRYLWADDAARGTGDDERTGRTPG
ncbi:ribbon-helix-helix protein, CopG family [uncultured Thiohalocapsa sp.]|uniref:ribbon-helix-helix protein, CopG family n=1 Tax=uncultured Thiohalocapsa sp. TaxID=768990 RepID=UPI0025F7F718|nr:ribbon-helix-helix protein, CopG family [uncultured Thiohalocapsa sp.]